MSPQLLGSVAMLGPAGVTNASTGLVGEDLALLERAVREELPAALRDKLTRVLLERPMLTVERALDSAYESAKPASLRLAASRGSSKEPHVTTNKHYLDFGCETMPVGQPLSDELVLTNAASCKAKFRVLLYDEGGMGNDFTLSASPMDGQVKKKSAATITFKLTLLRPCKVGLVVIVVVEGGIRYHLVVKKSSALM